ncbi:MAG: chemotaxis protein CheW, partial [Gammaproteobacteria bacterium]|nr:chemotaxis protein CheW [Gammaproteobacteria bacterium]
MNAVPGPRDLSALLVPVTGQLLVVPGAVVAEIIKRRDLQRPPAAPDWLLG